MINQSMLEQFLIDNIPFNRVLGIQISEVGSDFVEITLPGKVENTNHIGGVHAAVLFGVAEAASGAMLANAFFELIGQGIIPLVANAQVKYRRGAQGTVKARAQLDQAEHERVRTSQEKKTYVPIKVQVFNEANEVAVELEFNWVLLRGS